MSANRESVTIPIFPCRSIDEQLEFYQALGFELTYRQAKPNLYACVRHRIVELHFFVWKQLDPSNSYSMCYVHVRDVDAVHKEFCENLKNAYGKVPSRGFPRITKPNNLVEDRRFNLIDPAGNRLLIGQKHASAAPVQTEQTVMAQPSRFANAFETAYRLAYAKDEPAEAAKVLDLVFSKAEEASASLRYKAYVLRADIAASMDEINLARVLMQEAEQLSLSGQEREEVVEATNRLAELKGAFGHGHS
ncbi:MULTISPECIES: VOC family protein [Brevibacillus]|uniref:bleomycin resistance protein n=1 Tax=Brevibacillus TaxID=55080 RepID=UPI00156B854C|nr:MULTISPECIES: VOC family protein [Brevibacillus]MED2257755.1 VOC family protein [Brevibacillus parabrevis]UED71215.1 VOC family protein [Brevibacillus sp. HD3.3A]